MTFLSQNISEDEAKRQFEGIEILLNQARHQEAWELISPLLKMKDSFKEETAIEIINLAGCAKTSLMALDEAQTLLIDGLNRSKAINYQFGEAVALYHLGAILRITGNLKDALEHSKQAKAILEEIKETLHIGYVHSEIGACYFKLGQFHKAQEHLEKSLSIHRKANNKDGLQWALGQISDVYYALGDFERAVQSSREATEVAEDTKNEFAVIKHSTLEGIVLKRQGRLSEAKAVFQTLVPKLESRDDRAAYSARWGILYNLAHTCIYLGEYEEARDILLHLLDQSKQNDFSPDLSASEGLGILAFNLGDYEKAAKHLEEAVSHLRSKGDSLSDKLILVEGLVKLITVYVHLKETAKATALLGEARSIRPETRYSAVIISYGEGVLAQAKRNLGMAADSFQECLNLATEIDLAEYKILSLFHLSQLELFEYHLSGSRENLRKTQLLLEDALETAQNSAMPLPALEIGILNGLACQTNMEFDNSLDYFQQCEVEAKRLGLTTKVGEIQDLIKHLRERRKQAAEQTKPELSLKDSHKLAEYVDNVQKLIRTYDEGRRAK